MERRKIFLLSPASCAGKRAALLLSQHADFAVAKKVRAEPGAPLGEVFSFLSGLYFRGKLAYATAFQNPPARVGGIHIITPTDGLRAPAALARLDDLERFAAVPIDADEPRYRIPLDHDAHALSKAVGEKCDVVLLGSIATGKYVDILLPIFGARLCFPREFLGHGDMARGGMLLKRAASGKEFNYLPVSDPSRLATRAKKARVNDARLEAEP
ncbi:MAG: hypothetical protein WD802_04200 [Gemmatimonadaceae bacterium]